jgi:L-lactate dehydrogenase
MLPQLLKVAPNAIYLLVSNPVDVLTYITHKISGLPAARVLGSGTVLDSSRFRFLIAQRCKVAIQNVHAYIIGEHGDSEIPLWSSASIANIPLHEWAVPGHGKLSVRDRVEIFQNVKTAAAQIIEGKGATNYAIGLATARIIESLIHNENRILPVSSLLTNYRGISDVCLSVACIVNRSGVEQTLDVPMNANEESGLKNSAETIKSAIKQLGF